MEPTVMEKHSMANRQGSECDLLITQVSGIPVIEPAVMEELFWAIVPQLTTVHPMEDWVVKGRDELAAHVSAALAPVQEYLGLYEA